MGYTPMIRQYLEIKKEYPDQLLFFRLGDFYELFFEDAKIASRELGIILTGRDGGIDERIPMCGVPHHAAVNYISKLISRNYSVAICDQVEDPAVSKGIVRREVTRVITPGTIIDEQLLEAKANNYLACVAPLGDGYSFAYADVSTGCFMTSYFSGDGAGNILLNEVSRIMPAEIITPFSFIDSALKKLKILGPNVIKGHCDDAFSFAVASRHISIQFGEDNYKEDNQIIASGALLNYIAATQKKKLSHVNKLVYYSPRKHMNIDHVTRRNLELTRSLQDGTQKNTLLWVIDHTLTSMGARMIKNWLEQPILEKDEVEMRLNAVEELTEDYLFRQEVEDMLKNISDLERLAGRVSFGNANARDLMQIKKSLIYLPKLKSILEKAGSEKLICLSRLIDPMIDVSQDLHEAITDDPPSSVKEGGIIKQGYNQEVDRLRSVRRDGKSMLAKLEEKERRRTGIKSLKVSYNKIFGYFIEITRSNLAQVPDDYVRKQTLANAERYITSELKEHEDTVLKSEGQLLQLEYDIFCSIRDRLAKQVHRMQSAAYAIAITDVLYSFAVAAIKGGYRRPEINDKGILRIEEGRHPVIEVTLDTGMFIPNDCVMDYQEKRLLIITGPNMAGKSTYLRQVALTVLMAQVGCFVPATLANICLVDRIFTRIGAHDNLAGGQSTFMVEMNECCTIVKGATSQSLIIMDEVGRGTSTYDGISIARALIEYIHMNIKAKTLFSTHYHELTEMASLEGINNYNMAIKEDKGEIIFLRKVIPGKADRSYGIHVAKLAGLPDEVVQRAVKILEEFESESRIIIGRKETSNDKGPGINENEQKVLDELRNLDIMSITPLEAINNLYLLQKALAH